MDILERAEEEDFLEKVREVFQPVLGNKGSWVRCAYRFHDRITLELPLQEIYMLPLNWVHGVFGTGRVCNRRPSEFACVIGSMVAVTDKSWTATRLHNEFL
jgi:hypothetical protein